MDSPPVRLGLVGCGRAANGLHLPALGRVDGVSVVAVADADAQARDATAAAHGVPAAYPSLRAMLDAEALDAVGICVPAHAHEAVALEALEAGMHLFVEKPLALDLDACDRIIDVAERAGRHVLVGYNLRHHRYVREMVERLEADEIGAIEAVRSTWTSAVRSTRPTPGWRDQRASGGGALFEIATHHVDLWRFLLGSEVETVYASGRSSETEDETVNLAATLANGVVISAVFSERTANEHSLTMYGRGGRIALDLYSFEGPDVTLVAGNPWSLPSRLGRLAATAQKLPGALAKSRLGGEFAFSYDREWEHFREVVAGNEAPAVTLDDGKRAVGVVLAAMASLESGQPVRVDDGPRAAPARSAA